MANLARVGNLSRLLVLLKRAVLKRKWKKKDKDLSDVMSRLIPKPALESPVGRFVGFSHRDVDVRESPEFDFNLSDHVFPH